ncbi:PAS domain S-box protein [Arcticibacter sp. MXS-1]|uniref:PAS domain S-box protein n=1 Tax=Arcticibacter sp. MXS-1 TaxID=3341726 RepID=UPI0035A82B5D
MVKSEPSSTILLIAFALFLVTFGCFSLLIYEDISLLKEQQQQQIAQLRTIRSLEQTEEYVNSLVQPNKSRGGVLHKTTSWSAVQHKLTTSVSQMRKQHSYLNRSQFEELQKEITALANLVPASSNDPVPTASATSSLTKISVIVGQLKKDVYNAEPVDFLVLTRTRVYIILLIISIVVIFLMTIFSLISKNIIRRKNAEERNRRNEIKLNSLFQQSPVMFMILDPYSLEVLDINNSAASFLGMTAADVTGKRTSDLGILSAPGDLDLLFRVVTESTQVKDHLSVVTKKNADECYITCNIDRVDLGDQAALFVAFFDVTMQREAESLVKGNQDVFATLFYKSPTILALADIETGAILEVNEKHEEFCGYSREEVYGKTPLELGLFEDAPLGSQILEEFRKQDHYQTKMDLSIVSKSGERKPVSYSADTIKLNGKRQKLVAIQDLVDVKKTEAMLKKSEEIYYSLFYKSPVILCISDADSGLFIDVNENFCNHFGYKKEEIIGRDSLALNIWPDYNLRGEILGELRKGTAVVNRQMYLMNKAQQALCLYGHIDLIHIDGSECMICAFIDATEENKARMEILKLNHILEQRVIERTKEIRDYKYALDESAIIAITDKHGLILHVNANFVLLSGYHKQDVYGRKVTLLLKIKDNELEESISNCIRTGKVWKGEVEQKTKTGTEYWTYTHVIPFLDGDDNPYQYLFIGWDITQKKVAELENEQVTRDLIQRNKNLEQYGYIISHNLRAPLSNILGIIQLFQSVEITTEEREALGADLMKCGSQLDQVITDLTAILHTSRDLAEAKEEIHLESLVTSVTSTLVPAFKREAAILNCDFRELETIYSIRSYLTSILYNLISNSIKYRNEYEVPLIEIKGFKTEGKGMICYSDNGLGMDLEKYGDKVFGLYKRFHSHKHGRGMGLFMVKTQVETLGGKITIQSEVQKGTRFTIELPLVQA